MINSKKNQKWLIGLFLIYIAGLIYLLFISPQFRSFSEHRTTVLNLVPFAEIGRFLNSVEELGMVSVWENLLGNILVFLPMGLLIPCIFKRMAKAYRTIIAGALLSAIAEALQLLFMVGICDIDDVILNTVGVALGYIVFKLITGTRRRA